MLIVQSPSTLSERTLGRLRRVPQKILARGFGALPRGSFGRALFWRMMLEYSFLRYCLPLTPFPIMILIWPELALPIGQAPLAMFAAVFLVESRLLSVDSPERRRKLIDPAEAERGADLLRANATDILTRIAAGRGLKEGVLHLVVEQTLLNRLPPLTLVTLQYEGAGPEMLELTPPERALIAERLFANGLSERWLHKVTLARNNEMHDIALDTRAISAHARLEAMAAARAAPALAPSSSAPEAPPPEGPATLSAPG